MFLRIIEQNVIIMQNMKGSDSRNRSAKRLFVSTNANVKFLSLENISAALPFQMRSVMGALSKCLVRYAARNILKLIMMTTGAYFRCAGYAENII